MSRSEAHERLVRKFEEAGATLLALPYQRVGPALRQVRWPETQGEEAGFREGTLRQLTSPAPGAAEISVMDRVFGLIGLIPADRVLLRRIVHARSLVSPLTGRHIYSWRKLGALLGADHKAVQRWHADAIEIILKQMSNLGKKT